MIKEMSEKLNIPSPLEINGEKITSSEGWEKIRPLVLNIMLENEYGYIPEKPEEISFEIKEFDERRYHKI